MRKAQAIQRVMDAICEIRTHSGKETVQLRANTRPLRDLDDFDSLSGVEAAVLLSNSVGFELPDHIFTGSKGQRVPSIGEIADVVVQATQPGSARHD